MRPTPAGQLGDTHYDGKTTWLCMGGTEWVDHLPREEPPQQVWAPNMRVYIAGYYIRDDSEGNLGVYLTEQEARDRVAREPRASYVDYCVEVWEVGADDIVDIISIPRVRRDEPCG